MDQNAPMQIILVRHGETALNAARVLQPPDTPLSALGLQQAGAVARRLAGDGVAGIVSSDLARARQNAEAIAGRCQNLKVVLSPALRERDFGDWRGLPYDSLPADALHTEAAPPGGESAADFAARCSQAWAALLSLQAHLGGALVVVSHGLTIGQWLAGLPLAPGAGQRGERLGNTAVTQVDATAPHTVRLFNCTRHLAAGLQEGAGSLSGG